MIRKIICPTDLSPAARNAMAYAAKLCQGTGSILELVHTEQISNLEMVFTGQKKIREVLSWSQALEESAQDLSLNFGISCTASVETGKQRLEDVISEKADSETLVVVGTNGADNAYQQMFGSNAYGIVMKTPGNILVIPEHVQYRTVRKVGVAWDYHLRERQLTAVKEFTKDIGAELIFVHISTHETLISEDVYRAKRAALQEEGLIDDDEVKFQRRQAKDIAEGLDEYLSAEHVDILALSLNHGRLVTYIFGSISQEAKQVNCPLLVLHGQ